MSKKKNVNSFLLLEKKNKEQVSSKINSADNTNLVIPFNYTIALMSFCKESRAYKLQNQKVKRCKIPRYLQLSYNPKKNKLKAV